MGKKLTIQANSCLISKDGIGDISFNGIYLDDLISRNLPTMKDYDNVPARVNISIELLDTDLNIEKEGYSNKETAPDVQGVSDKKNIPVEKEAF